MKVSSRIRGLESTGWSRAEMTGLLQESLNRFEHRVKHIELHVQDANGPRGGVDKQVRCVIHAKGIEPIVIEDQDADLVAAMHRVSHRAAYTLSEKVHRRDHRQGKHCRRVF